MSQIHDTGARPVITRDPARPGWLCIRVERAKGERRLWVSIDEAALLRAELDKQLPTVTTRRVPASAGK